MKSPLAPWLLLLLITLWPGSPLRAKEPEPRHELGLSVHLVPEHLVGARMLGLLKPGFVVSAPGESRPPAQRPTAPSVTELVALFRQQPAGVQQNGLWLVLTNAKLYSRAEKDHVRELKEACRRERIPLFMCRDNELPKGWQRFSRHRWPGAGLVWHPAV